jgi:hypothetical protein
MVSYRAHASHRLKTFYKNQLASKRDISKLGIIVLSIILITGISFIPVLQAGV